VPSRDRSRNPFRAVGEITHWEGHSPERLKQMRDFLEDLKRRGVAAIEGWAGFASVMAIRAVVACDRDD